MYEMLFVSQKLENDRMGWVFEFVYDRWILRRQNQLKRTNNKFFKDVLQETLIILVVPLCICVCVCVCVCVWDTSGLKASLRIWEYFMSQRPECAILLRFNHISNPVFKFSFSCATRIMQHV